MAKVLVTGATGFIGSHVALLLAERGEDVTLGVQDGSPDAAIAGLDCRRLKLELRDRRTVRRALRGAEQVFHCAGVTSVRAEDAERAFDVNVTGTRLMMEECLRAGVERVVYTSSAAAVGPAPRGRTADESQLYSAGRLGIPYVDSVHEGELEALRVAARGLPLVCVNPAVCFGPGDNLLSSTRIVRSFLLGRVPVHLDGAASIVDVRDVATGHLLAAEHGEIGGRYILSGRNFTYDRLFADLGRLSGVEPPVKLPTAAARAAGELISASGRSWPLTETDVRAAGQWWTYRSTKARRDLGWQPRPHEETLEATVTWHLEREHERMARIRGSQAMTRRLAALAVGVGETTAGFLRRLPLPRP